MTLKCSFEAKWMFEENVLGKLYFSFKHLCAID
jgi:hypothetical protein